MENPILPDHIDDKSESPAVVNRVIKKHKFKLKSNQNSEAFSKFKKRELYLD